MRPDDDHASVATAEETHRLAEPFPHAREQRALRRVEDGVERHVRADEHDTFARGHAKRGAYRLRRGHRGPLDARRCRVVPPRLPRLDELADAPGSILRSEGHKSELTSLMRISYAVFCSQTNHTSTVLRLNK